MVIYARISTNYINFDKANSPLTIDKNKNISPKICTNKIKALYLHSLYRSNELSL